MSESAERVTAEACVQANVMGIISGNQCILSHLKASEPFVAFLSHEVPKESRRNRQVGPEHGHTQTHTYEHRTQRGRSSGCNAAVLGCGAAHTHTHTHTHTHSDTCRVENQYWMISLLFNGSYSPADDHHCTWRLFVRLRWKTLKHFIARMPWRSYTHIQLLVGCCLWCIFIAITVFKKEGISCNVDGNCK